MTATAVHIYLLLLLASTNHPNYQNPIETSSEGVVVVVLILNEAVTEADKEARGLRTEAKGEARSDGPSEANVGVKCSEPNDIPYLSALPQNKTPFLPTAAVAPAVHLPLPPPRSYQVTKGKRTTYLPGSLNHAGGIFHQFAPPSSNLRSKSSRAFGEIW